MSSSRRLESPFLRVCPTCAGRPIARSTSWSRSRSAPGSSEVSISTTQLKNQVSADRWLARLPLPRLRLVERGGVEERTSGIARNSSTARRRHSSRSPRLDPTERKTRDTDSPLCSAAACELYAGNSQEALHGRCQLPDPHTHLRQGNSPSSICASRPASRSSRFTRSTVPISTMRAVTRRSRRWCPGRRTPPPAPGPAPAPRRPRTRRPPSARPAVTPWWA